MAPAQVLVCSFSAAEAGSPRPWLWHVPLGPDSAAPGCPPAPSPFAGAGSHIQCMGSEQGRVSSAVALSSLAGSRHKSVSAKYILK